MRKVFMVLLMLLFYGSLFAESKPVTQSTEQNKQVKEKLNSIVKRLKDPYKELSKEEWKELREGEVVTKNYIYTTPEGKQAGMAKGIILANLPPQAIWNVLLDFEHYADFLPSLKSTKILKRFPDGSVWLLHVLKIVFVKIKYVCKLTPVEFPDGSKLLQWKEVKVPGIKNDLKDTTGFWEVIPIDNGQKTILTYTAFVDTGWAVPGWVQKWLTRKQLPKVLKGTVEEAEKRYKK